MLWAILACGDSGYWLTESGAPVHRIDRAANLRGNHRREVWVRTFGPEESWRGGVACQHVGERASGSGERESPHAVGAGLAEMSDEFDPSVYARRM